MRTAKQEVIAMVPDADCFGPPIYIRSGYEFKGPPYVVIAVEWGCDIGWGDTEDEAWQHALDRINTELQRQEESCTSSSVSSPSRL